MSDPTLTPPPAAPQPTDDIPTFNTKAFSFFGWFSGFIDEMQAVIAWISERAGFAGSSAQSAAQGANQATAAASQADASKTAAAQSEANALTYAQVAGSGAGIPTPEAGKYLGTDAQAQPAWVDVPTDASKLDKKGGVATALGYSYKDHGTIAAAGTAAINMQEASIQRVQATGALTITISGWATDGRCEELEIQCVNFGGKTVNWPPGKWQRPDGSWVDQAGNSGVIWTPLGTDYVLAMRDWDGIRYKVMR